MWKVGGYVLNKAAASGSEVLVYENGAQITSFTASSNAENTNDFGTVQTYYYGARGAAGGSAASGSSDGAARRARCGTRSGATNA